MQACTLSEGYLTEDDDARAREELACTKDNATEARDCALLKEKCADALRDRAATTTPGSTAH